MITTDELRDEFPEYEKMGLLDRIVFEELNDSEISHYRRKFETSLEIILAAGLPFATHLLTKNGYIPEPGVITYGLSTVIGFIAGKTLGLGLGELLYDMKHPDGTINNQYQRLKELFYIKFRTKRYNDE